MKYCPQCGTPCDDNAVNCPNCGSRFGGYAQAPGMRGTPQRSIALSIILYLVTCGLYGIYWMIVLNDEVNAASGEVNATSGGVVFLLSLVTCGIYGLYWMYKMGERCDRIKGYPASSGIVYLLLAIFGLGVVSMALMQDTLNKAG